MNGKQIIKRLESEGWKLERVNGSHHMMKKDGKLVPVPVHGSRDVKPGTFHSIEKETGVKLK
ncbi:type II toxin-antitoxin system HicA family toxin [Nitrosomonas sp.]|uniref:type II toxin-antitoxin system HicA family toxin n=1 Tax=Nitrosomonas sp. TaxID=42353 RepID=UPI0025F7727C|nr:type II toxin-antitoxin system HicA family toxin [Nitrosomonas sp.]